jgi:hypothetical protein
LWCRQTAGWWPLQQGAAAVAAAAAQFGEGWRSSHGEGVEVLVFDCFFYYISLVTFVCQTLIKRLGYDMGSTHDARQKQGLRGSLPLWSYSKRKLGWLVQ